MTPPSPHISDPREKRWKQLFTKTPRIGITSIAIADSEVFAPQTIELGRAIAFAGAHGTGKTLLLRALYAASGGAIDGEAAAPPFFRDGWPHSDLSPLVGECMAFSYETPKGPATLTVFSDAPFGQRQESWKLSRRPTVWYLSAVQAFARLAEFYGEVAGTLGLAGRPGTERERQGRLNAALSAPEWLSAEDVRGLCRILGQRFTRVSVQYFTRNYRYLSGDQDFQIPFVTAIVDGSETNSTRMSSGELWVHVVLNGLFRKVQPGDVVLLDEPESFLAVRGQRPFIDEVARYALRSDVQLIVATHSPEILFRFPLQYTRLCVRSRHGIQVLRPTSSTQISDAIGVRLQVGALILVEDDLAARLLRAIFAELAPMLVRKAEVVAAGGASAVLAGMRAVRRSKQIAFLAVLDGDQRAVSGKRSDTTSESGEVAFLPGSASPEIELLDAASREPAAISTELGLQPEEIVAAVQSLSDLDHQYRLNRLSVQLGQDEATVLRSLVRVWLRGATVREEAHALVKRVLDLTEGAEEGGS